MMNRIREMEMVRVLRKVVTIIDRFKQAIGNLIPLKNYILNYFHFATKLMHGV